MTDKIYALDQDHSEWTRFFTEELGQPSFRADQTCQWIWQKKVFDIGAMTDLSKPLREELKERVDLTLPLLVKEERSSVDGTRKYLWQFRDGESVESVLMRREDRLTACVSTQVGCPLGCTFCATGLSGFVRNLSAGEIAGQFLAMEKTIGRDINNVVYMGMGEPFLNTEAVLKSASMLKDPKMRNLGVRHIVISTSGVIPGILELARSGIGVRLAVSLHAAEDGLRGSLMPINETYPLSELKAAMKEYQRITGDRVTIEYALFGGLNDSVEHARELLRYLMGIHVFINLIPYNQTGGRYEKPRSEDVLRFRSILETAGFEADIREARGSDINAACGQLRRKTGDGVSRHQVDSYKSGTIEKARRRERGRSGRSSKDAAAPRKTQMGPARQAANSADAPIDREREPLSAKRSGEGYASKKRQRSGKMKEERPSPVSDKKGRSARPFHEEGDATGTKGRKKRAQSPKRRDAASRSDDGRGVPLTKGKRNKKA